MFRSRVARRAGLALATAMALAGIVATTAMAVPVSGVVFTDFNDNGVQDAAPAVDAGVGGVTVRAFAADGSEVARATTAPNGTYVLDVAQSAGRVRVQFDDLPDGFESGRVSTAGGAPVGAKSGTTVQFVDVSAGAAAGVSLGILRPSQYCQDNPELIVACMYFDEATAGENAAAGGLLGFRLDAGADPSSTDDAALSSPTNRHVVAYRSIGSTYGVAYQRSQRRLFAGAFLRHHTSFGPAGTGAIYSVDPASGATSTFADLNALFGADTAGADPHLSQQPCPPFPTRPYACDNFNAVFGRVHKIGLGALALNEDGSRLYAVNLADRRVYELPTGTTPTAANVRRTAVPLDLPGCASQDDARPFALTWHRDSLYLGMTCTGQSTGSAGDLAAHVYRLEPATLAASASPVFSMQLGNYERGCYQNSNGYPFCRQRTAADWTAWSDEFSLVPQANYDEHTHPQPTLADIDFDAAGSMILGVRDRSGDQLGNQGFEEDAATGQTIQATGISAGDVLLACGDATSGWTLESNGSCGGRTGSGAGDAQGPGGGEFLGGDDWPGGNLGLGGHHEVSLGSLVALPGYPEIKTTAFDPAPDAAPATQGIRTHNLENGTLTRSYILAAANNGGFAKANGLGDIVAMCDEAPLQIGNVIWLDANKDGIQGADETPLAGVTVELLDADGNQIASTTTDSNGQYFFDESNLPGGIQPDTDYIVSIPLDQSALAPYVLTSSGAGSNDQIDSDGAEIGGAARVTVRTGSAGHNNHTYDFGFQRRPTPPTMTPTTTTPATPAASTTPAQPRVPQPDVVVQKSANRARVQAGGLVRYTIAVRNRRRGSVARNVRVCDQPPVTLVIERAVGARVRHRRACWTVATLRYSRKWRRMTLVARVLRSTRASSVTNTATAGRRRARATVRVRRAARTQPPAVTG